MSDAKVLIIMGSINDRPIMEGAKKSLDEFGVSNRMIVASAHRTPARTAELASSAKENGTEVIIAGAGFAAHLAGVIAAHTTLPVIGVPLDSSPLKGIDSLYSTVQMPSGIPVATMSVGSAGAKNAGIFAAQMIALSDKELAEKLVGFRRKMAEKVEAADRELNDGVK